MHAQTIRWTVALLIVVAAGSPALAQLSKKDRDEEKEKDRAKKAARDAAAAQAAVPTEPLAEKVLVLEKSKDWTMTIDLRIQAGNVKDVVDGQIMTQPVPFKFSSAAVVFPMLTASAAHRLELDGGNAPKYKGELKFDNVLMDSKPTFIDGYAGGTKLARWEMRGVEGNDTQLHLEYQMTCWNSVLDETLARTIPWPKGAWPAPAASALKPHLFVESDAPAVTELLQRTMEGNDPKSQPPAVLAKHLAGQVMGLVQTSGNGLLFNQNSTFRGFDLKGAAATARDLRGSQHDVACLLAAVYRAAGLPARVVIGYDKEETTAGGGSSRNNPLSRSGSGPSNLRSWVEFALVDPFDSKPFWIPVDIVRLRKQSSRPPAFDATWKFFGTHDELNAVLPIAFQYHPPTSVTALAPGFWGWVSTPETAMGVQSLRFSAIRTPQRGDEPSRRNRTAPGRDR